MSTASEKQWELCNTKLGKCRGFCGKFHSAGWSKVSMSDVPSTADSRRCNRLAPPALVRLELRCQDRIMYI